MNQWYEELPEKCPPSDAYNPNGKFYYRLVQDLKNCEADLVSHRFLDPEKKFNADECICRAVSVFENIEDCENLTKLPRHKNKHILKLKLNQNDGLIKQTGKPSHHSWWRSINFVLENE